MVRPLIDEPTDLASLTVAFALAQDRVVRDQGRSAYMAGLGRMTANPERRYCPQHQAWVWNGQVKERGKERRVCRWCKKATETPWRSLKTGSRVKTMLDAVTALKPFGARGREDSTFCYFHILPSDRDVEIERVLALYGSGLGVSFYLDHTEPAVLDFDYLDA
jgi:hypothetical protein